MIKMVVQLAIMMLIASATFAAEYQGEVIKIKGDQITIEIFGNESAGIKAGAHVNLKAIPKNVPTLDMLKG